MPAAQAALLWGALLAVLASAGQADAATAPGAAQPAYQAVPGRLIVKLRPDVVTAMDTDSSGLRFSRQLGSLGAVYDITDGTSVQDKVAELQEHRAVEYVEPDYRVPINWQPNDSLIKLQWHHDKIGSQLAWNASRGRPEIKVCHIDSGIRVDHADLAGRLLKGWNMVPETQEFDQPPPAPDSPAYLDVNDTYGHGTHTAGLIAAVGNNALGVAGLAMDVKLLVCRFIWDDGMGSISDALTCLRLCKQEGAQISSNSWGGVPHSKAIEEGLKEVQAAGMLFVVASGNQGNDLDSKPSFPASSRMDNVLVVGSSGMGDLVSSFSNYGKSTVHMLAPGEQVLSTLANGWYGPMDGTSMACPLVAAAAALLHSAALSQGAQLTYADLKGLLLASVDPSPAAAAGATQTGGRLNVGTAMAALALLLQQRGHPGLPGGWLVGPSPDAAALAERLRQNPWGKALLQAPAAAAAGQAAAQALPARQGAAAARPAGGKPGGGGIVAPQRRPAVRIVGRRQLRSSAQ